MSKYPEKRCIFFYKKAKIALFYEYYFQYFAEFMRMYIFIITKNYKKNMFGKIYSHLVILNLEQYFIINYYWPIFIPTPNLYLPAA